MKKISFFVFVLFVCGIVFAGFRSLNVSAQNDVGNTDESDLEQRRIKDDRALATRIRQMTNRSPEGLIKQKIAGGGFMVNLENRYQNVMLARASDDSGVDTACVTGLGEANEFFGRNLETGEPIATTVFQKDETAQLTAQYGIPRQEYEFYKNLIEEAAASRAASPNAATITIVNKDAPNEGFNDPAARLQEGGSPGTTNPGTTLGEQRINLFNQAASIWGAFLDTNVTIRINSEFNSLSPCSTSGGVLGSAGSNFIFSDFPGSAPNTFYHAALANKISRMDLDNANEINATFNSDVDTGCLGGGRRFYYGYDISPDPNNVNLLIVLLHEMGHGLGFQSFANSSTGQFPVAGYTDVFSRFTFDGTTGKFWNQMTDAERQTSAKNTNNVFWDGANVKIASGFLGTNGRDSATGRVQLFTPNPIQGGSSVSHWNTTAFPNLLMEPVINSDLDFSLDLTRQQMRDIGWYRDTNTADTIKDAITTVQPTGTVRPNTSTTVTWSNVGGFNKNVKVELSTDNGANYTTLDANKVNTGSITFTAPNTTTTQALVRVTEVDFAEPRGISNSFSILAPTAATVSVSGKVINSLGRGISNATVTVIGNNGETLYGRTNTFGYFAFSEIAAGETYIFQVKHKQFTFAPQVLNITEDLSDVNFVAQP